MKSFFDDVFDNKIFFEKEDLLKAFNDKLNEKESLTIGDMSDPSLETLMREMRENPERPFTKKEAKILKEKLTQVKARCKTLIDSVRDRKEMIDRIVRGSDESFTLDISKSSRLKNSATNIFGGLKREITYDDYRTLIEIKRQIELSEALDIIEEVVENGGI